MLIVPDSIMTTLNEIQACERKSEACLKGLKCLKKELLGALSNELKFLLGCLYEKQAINISQKCTYRISTTGKILRKYS